jgi:hypothetical protein
VHPVVPGAVNTRLVQSFELVGIDKDDPRVRRLIGAFIKHAAAPEDVAAFMPSRHRAHRFSFTPRSISGSAIGGPGNSRFRTSS